MSSSKEYHQASRSSESDSPLLEDEGSLGFVYKRPQSKFRRILRKMLWPIVIHGLFFWTYTGVFVYFFNAYVKDNQQNCHKPLVYTPAREAVTYEKIDYDGGLYKESIYKGPPTPERDAAWTELVAPTNLIVDQYTLAMINRTALELSDHSGYHGGLSVHHHLHCLKYIRQALHPDYYKMELDIDPDLMEHIYHCIDDVRQALMCNPDLTIYTHVWTPGYRKPWPNFDVEHECVSWEKLNGWAIDNSFDMFKPGLLIHPDLGYSFPIIDGEVQLSALSNKTVFVYPDQDQHDHSVHSTHEH